MATWDTMWEAVWIYAGRPSDRPRTAYLLLDSRLKNESFASGYPVVFASNHLSYVPENIRDGLNSEYTLNVLDGDFGLHHHPDTFLHESGHNLSLPSLQSEAETVVHMLHAAMYNLGRGRTMDEAFSRAMVNVPSGGHTFEEAAMDWMLAYNFRNNNPMGCDPTMAEDVCHEFRYQNRGHAKYADIAILFGWATGIGEINRMFYNRWGAQPDGLDKDEHQNFVTDDDYIETASRALGVNAAPLFHFWGIHPSDQLAATLADTYPRSDAIKNRFDFYRNLVPLSLAQFQPWYDSNRPVAGAPHYERYDNYLASYDSDNIGQQILDQIDLVEALYFCLDCGFATPFSEPVFLDAGDDFSLAEGFSVSLNLSGASVPLQVLSGDTSVATVSMTGVYSLSLA